MKKLIFLLVGLQTAVTVYGKEYTQVYEDKLIQDIKGIYTQEAIKTPDNPTGHPIDATPLILQAKHDFPFLSSEAKKAIYPFVSRPSFAPDSEYTYDSPSQHFKIHFAKTGTNVVFEAGVDNNGNGVPDYVDECATILDYVWAKEVDTLGYIPPPSDDWYPGWDNGGDGKYDIYLLNLGSSYLGATYPETTQNPGSQIWTSFIELDNDYLGYPIYHSQYAWLQVTAAHEFFHAIQFGYDVYENEVAGDVVKPYWMEMSATWMEDQVYDNINDYIYYLPAFFYKPWLSLRNFDGLHPYGSCIWPIYLSERKGFGGRDIIKEIWIKCNERAGDNVLLATDEILRSKGGSLDEAFREFTVWNYFTGSKYMSILGFYSEGEEFPLVKIDNLQYHEQYPVNVDSLVNYPDNLGANYVIFRPLAEPGGLRITFYGNAGVGWKVSNISYAGELFTPIINAMFLDSMNRGGAEICDWNFFPEIAMVVARGDTSSSRRKYSYQAEFDTSLRGCIIFPQADSIKQNFPNPFVIRDGYSTTKFPVSLKSFGDVKLFIFAVSGELVWDNLWRNVPAADYDKEYLQDYGFFPFEWNGRNKKGEYVASGIYIYRIVTDNTSVTKKLVVITQR
jgi:hypothetical protein